MARKSGKAAVKEIGINAMYLVHFIAADKENWKELIKITFGEKWRSPIENWASMKK